MVQTSMALIRRYKKNLKLKFHTNFVFFSSISKKGTDINVPPRTIHSESDNRYPSLKSGEIDDGQYREDPNIYLDSKYHSRPSSKAASTFRINSQSQAPKAFAPTQNYNYQTTAAPIYEEQQPQVYQNRFKAATQSQSFFQQPQQSNNYQQQQQPNYYQPQQQQPNYYQQPKSNYQQQQQPNYYQQTPNIFAGHPAQNFDVLSGSYTVQY